MTDLPDGYYATPDPDNPATMTYWRAENGCLAIWPPKAWYGPARLLKRDTPQGRDAKLAWYTAWSNAWQSWATRVREALETDPHGALRRFAEFSVRCCQCGRALTDDTSKVLGIGPDCRRGIDPAFLAAVTTPQVAATHAARADRLTEPPPPEPTRTDRTTMTHRIEPGQEYAACDPRDHIRIRVVAAPCTIPGYDFGKVEVVTLTADSRELRRRQIEGTQLHETGLTRSGTPRRSGYRLVRHADGSTAGGAA